MDEATIQRLASLVKGMHDQGMSVKQIEDNLSQMGIAKSDINVILARAGIKPSTADVHEEVSSVKRSIETGEAFKPVVEKLGETHEHLGRLHTEISALHEKHEELSSQVSKLASSQSDIQEMKALLYEIKDLLEAVKKLQQDLIEINRKVLAKEL